VSLRTAYSCFGVAALIFVVVAFANARPTRQEIGTLNGTLLDPQGAAVANAGIELRWNYVGAEMCWNAPHCGKTEKPRKRFLRVGTNMAGQFSAHLPPGNWDVFAFRDGYAPTCTIVLIQPGQGTPVELRFSGMAAMSVQ
jgi:hypothetical protein